MSNIQELRNELYDVLLMVTEREPFDLVLNSTCGFEAWRRLSRRFDPTTGGRKRALLNSILTPNRTKLEELPQALEKLLDSIRLYERRRDSTGARTTISEDIKISVIERLVPSELERHLVLNRDRYASFNDILGEIQSYVEHQTGSKIKVFNSQGRVDPHNRPDDPMDVGYFGKGKKGKGKNSSKGGKPGDKKSETCFNCGKPGHRKADCWAPGEEKQIPDHQSMETPKDPERKDRKAAKEKVKEKERRAKESPSRSAMWKLKTKNRKPKAGMPAGKAMMTKNGSQRLKVRRIILALELLTKTTQKTIRSLMTTRKEDEEEDIGTEGGEIIGLQLKEEIELQQGEVEVS